MGLADGVGMREQRVEEEEVGLTARSAEGMAFEVPRPEEGARPPEGANMDRLGAAGTGMTDGERRGVANGVAGNSEPRPESTRESCNSETWDWDDWEGI